jgi:hypothetical protein
METNQSASAASLPHIYFDEQSESSLNDLECFLVTLSECVDFNNRLSTSRSQSDVWQRLEDFIESLEDAFSKLKSVTETLLLNYQHTF